MKKYFFVFILVFLFLGSSCVSTNKSQENFSSKAVPKWVTDQGRLELFPNSIYISQLAYGSSAQESKEKASANISEYIKSSVVSSNISSYSYEEINGSHIEKRDLTESVSISTDNNLYKIEYTNPFFFAEMGQYACVAYINKEQAFNFVKPKLDLAKKEFPIAYTNSLKKESLIEKIISIKNAQELLVDFYEVYDFARAICPEKSKMYEEIDYLAKESFHSIKELSSSVLIKIEGRGDIDSLKDSGVITELANQFEKLGFVVTNGTKNNCIAFVSVKVSISKTKQTFECYPEINVSILEDDIEKISYSKKLSKVAGFDKDTVIRRVNIALLKEIKTSFVAECL